MLQRNWGVVAIHDSLLLEVDASRSTLSIALGMGCYSGRQCDLMAMNVGGGAVLWEMSLQLG